MILSRNANFTVINILNCNAKMEFIKNKQPSKNT